MLHILLLILKIIGIIIGVLLGIVVLGIALALFVPVRYSVEASRTEGEGNPPVEVKAKVSWLLHLVNVKVCYPSESWLRARILFITVFKLPKKKDTSSKTRGEKKKKAAKSAKAKPVKGADEAAESKTAAEEAKVTDTPQIKGEIPADEPTHASPEEDKVPEEPEKTESSKKKRKHPKFSIKGLWEKICKFFQNIYYTITGICDKIKMIRENIEYYLNILQSDTFKTSYELCKDELRSIFSYIKPRKFQADVIIGLDDPASTAKILSYYGILYPFVGNHVTVVPDFDKKRMEGTVIIKGKIKLFTFIKAAVRIYFNKDIKRLIKLFMKEDV